MAVIKDIRIYRSDRENIDGNSLPAAFTNKNLDCTIRRIVMKLREGGFSLGDFDHLYVNLTICPVENKISPAGRSFDRYHPWLRWYDAEIDRELFDGLLTPRAVMPVTDILKQILIGHFCTSHFPPDDIRACIVAATTQGANMLVRFKEKESEENRVVVYLRYLDNGHYRPLLHVFDREGRLLLEKDLPEEADLNAYGEIRLSRTKVTIKPKKNRLTKGRRPIEITF